MDTFVGFAASPKPRVGAKVESLKFEIESHLGIKDCLAFATTKSGLEKWLGEFEKFDLRQGAKLFVTRDEEKFGVSFAQINIPKSVILVTEHFGQVELSFKEKKNSVYVGVNFQKAVTPEELATWKELVAGAKSVMMGELSD